VVGKQQQQAGWVAMDARQKAASYMASYGDG
jgi:hypothetical protein